MNGEASVIDLHTNSAKPFNFLDAWGHVAVAPNGKYLATIGNSSGPRRGTEWQPCLCGWKMTATGPELAWERKTPKNGAVPWAIIYAGNDTLVTEDRADNRHAHGFDNPVVHQLAIRSATDGIVQTKLDLPTGDFAVVQLLTSLDGMQVVARCGTSLCAWKATDRSKLPKVVEGKDHYLYDPRAAAFHHSGQYLLLAGNNGPSVIAFDTSTWKPARRWNWKSGVLRSVAISSDGTLAAAAGPSGTVVVWDLDL